MVNRSNESANGPGDEDRGRAEQTPPPLPLDYAHHPASPRPQPLFEQVGQRFGVGVALVAIVAFVLMTRRPQTPEWAHSITWPAVLYACGGIPVMIIQIFLLAVAVDVRERFSGHLLKERSGWLTFGVGILSGVLVYTVGWILEQWGIGDAAGWPILCIPLCLGPLVLPFFLLRPSAKPKAS